MNFSISWETVLPKLLQHVWVTPPQSFKDRLPQQGLLSPQASHKVTASSQAHPPFPNYDILAMQTQYTD